jgi:hypothetical protein
MPFYGLIVREVNNQPQVICPFHPDQKLYKVTNSNRKGNTRIHWQCSVDTCQMWADWATDAEREKEINDRANWETHKVNM